GVEAPQCPDEHDLDTDKRDTRDDEDQVEQAIGAAAKTGMILRQPPAHDGSNGKEQGAGGQHHAKENGPQLMHGNTPVIESRMMALLARRASDGGRRWRVGLTANA